MARLIPVASAGFRPAVLLMGLATAACDTASRGPAPVPLTPASMLRAATVEERYQSYNVEMLEVTGGKFWRPFGPELDSILRGPTPDGSGETPAGMDPGLYEYRPPLDLADPRLRVLAAALGPAYVRISGTWANTTYFADSDRTSKPPPGFNGALTRAQWKGVIDFANAVDGAIVTSFATSVGTRDRSGTWKPDLARRWVAYTESNGGKIVAAEFMNEPNLAAMGGAPAGYDPAGYGRDFKVFRAFVDEVLPDMIVLGPGAVGEATGGEWQGMAGGYGGMAMLGTREMLVESQPAAVDAFSYHHYGAVSLRCAAIGAAMQTAPEQALSDDWLSRTDQTLAFYRPLRDEFAAGTPFWNTETADAACGGNPWGRTFLDTFRYLDQLGRLARQEVRVVMHNTLVASDYGLLDDKTLEPKPNYWGALLWRRLMGTTVLDPGASAQAGLRLYAHCLRGRSGGVAVLALNTDTGSARTLSVPLAMERYTLAAPVGDLQSRTVGLNGSPLVLAAGNALPQLTGSPVPAGEVSLAPGTITFLAVPEAGNPDCL